MLETPHYSFNQCVPPESRFIECCHRDRRDHYAVLLWKDDRLQQNYTSVTKTTNNPKTYTLRLKWFTQRPSDSSPDGYWLIERLGTWTARDRVKVRNDFFNKYGLHIDPDSNKAVVFGPTEC